ncbi:class I SAM-dependent methyltransferase [Actinokineospora sp. PR83]|uniref:class I SAM-dependent methyltransferase n=1 Tax=Actinokineospora sp. PR83 TaxID=2884908 RepID=UPI0027E020C5|nr:class I SAM-dependent methyltransferase [Actinokineospora sp. PR83]MCG8918635.1 class I SAM-dependent methyltransferase [Actinokineospora sp. PR83]
MDLDATGKTSFDHIYTEPDPRAYFSALRGLDYQIPELAKPYFAKLIQEYRQTQGVAVPQVLDIGCSYGINAALLRCDATMDELYTHYTDPAVTALDRDGLLAVDRAMVRSRDQLDGVRFVGFDASAPALAYAHAAGYLEDTVHADLEAGDPTPEQRARLSGTDLVISTGCVGYVTEATLTRVAAAQDGPLPWMAHFVLRMFPYTRVADALSDLGYDTVHVEGAFKQRRFASAEEQAQVLDTIAEAGVDPTGLESEGWLYAELHLSRPRGATPPRA